MRGNLDLGNEADLAILYQYVGVELAVVIQLNHAVYRQNNDQDHQGQKSRTGNEEKVAPHSDARH